MSEAGVGVVLVGAVVGGAVAAGKIDDLCSSIDTVEPETWEGKALSTLAMIVTGAEDEVRKGQEQAQKLLVSVNEKYDLVAKKVGQAGHTVAKEIGQAGHRVKEKGGETVGKVKDWAHHHWIKEVKEGGQM